MVVAPALARSRLEHWLTSDSERRRADALERLDASVSAFTAAGIPAQGALGDADPLQALDDAIRTFDPDEVIISTHPPQRSNWLERQVVSRARERYDLPITHVVVDLELEAAAAPTPVSRPAPAPGNQARSLRVYHASDYDERPGHPRVRLPRRLGRRSRRASGSPTARPTTHGTTACSSPSTCPRPSPPATSRRAGGERRAVPDPRRAPQPARPARHRGRLVRVVRRGGGAPTGGVTCSSPLSAGPWHCACQLATAACANWPTPVRTGQSAAPSGLIARDRHPVDVDRLGGVLGGRVGGVGVGVGERLDRAARRPGPGSRGRSGCSRSAGPRRRR